MPFWPLCSAIEAILTFSSRLPGLECSHGKIFIPITRVSVTKTEVSVARPARFLVWTHRNFNEGMSGEARYQKPRQADWPGSYEETPLLPLFIRLILTARVTRHKTARTCCDTRLALSYNCVRMPTVFHETFAGFDVYDFCSAFQDPQKL